MAGYDFLAGVRVLEVAQLGPASLGGYLADLGAEVIKIEGPHVDPLRYVGSLAVGAPDGPSLLHLRWNRGKQSVGLDLKHPAGRQLFHELADRSQVVVEGTRAGVLERLGVGYEDLRRTNPRLVFCSLSGLGTSGPYHTLGSHAPAFDAFGALGAVNIHAVPADQRGRTHHAPIGMHAMGLYAALAVLAAVVRAERRGEGAYVEVSGAEAAAHWLPDGVDRVLNSDALVDREPPFTASDGRMLGWPRLHPYITADGHSVFLQAEHPKFWARFCAAVGRPGLDAQPPAGADRVASDEMLHSLLVDIFRTRSRAEWLQLFLDHDVPGIPVNTLADLAIDPHFLARDNVYEVTSKGNKLRLTSTPIKAPGQSLQPTLAPDAWADTEAVLTRILGVRKDELETLAVERAILTRLSATDSRGTVR